LRIRNGSIQIIETKTNYNVIRDYLAQRTYDESGNYAVSPFTISLHNSLNDSLGSDGLYFSNEVTDQMNVPSDDLMSIKVSPGKAYVKGYDIEKTGTTIIDVNKPRDIQKVFSIGVPFQMGNLIRVNNVYGAPIERNSLVLQDKRRNDYLSANTIGDARVYTFNLTDSAYNDATTNWDLYLYDIQTYTKITLNKTVSDTELPQTSYVKGVSSGASGYAVSSGNNLNTITLRQVSGTFSVGEQLIINGTTQISVTTKSIKSYTLNDVKSVYQSGSPGFIADTVLSRRIPYGFNSQDQITISTNGTITSPNKLFSGISTDSIIRYNRVGFITETYNRVTSVSSDGFSMTVSGIATVNGICDGALPSSQTTSRFSVGAVNILNQQNAYLYSKLPNSNISNIYLSSSNLIFSAQSSITPTISTNRITISPSDFNLPVGLTTASFEAFNEQRYSIHYSDGSIEHISPDEVGVSPTQITFSNISNKTVYKINATFIKSGIQSKLKNYSRSKVLNINLSKYNTSGTDENTSINDGLTYNQYYGLRVQDEEICLNYPDVVRILAVYESLNSSSPVLDQISFSSTVNVSAGAIIGENIIGTKSKTVARIVSKPSGYPNNLNIVYLNSNRFSPNELVTFEESNISAEIDGIIFGKYKDITYSFKLDAGQKEQYYDYSRLIRNKGESEPSRQLLIVFDYYTVSSSDNGDAFTVLSYTQNRFGKDIPQIGTDKIRATDTLDFRPRVSDFTSNSSSPFDFSSRNFAPSPKVILKPNESSLVSYDFYLGRIDKLYLDKFGALFVQKGVSSPNPKEPIKDTEVLELATITLPPYLYKPGDAKLSLVDNRRYTMKDIGIIENRVENLERVTSLSLLELNTQTLQIRDADGFNRFKTGFFVDDFKSNSLVDLNVSLSEVNTTTNQLTPLISRNNLKSQIAPSKDLSITNLDLSTNFSLLDSNVQKTGRVITLQYTEVDWIEQPFGTRTENVNPFHVVLYSGQIKLNPTRDNWIRTVQLPTRILTHNNTLNLRTETETNRVSLNNVDNTTSVGTNIDGRTVTVADTFTTLSSNTSSTTSSSRSSDTSTSETSETAFVSSNNDTFMRSRNTEFVVENLKPHTQFYQFFDGSSFVDFVPKLIEISNGIDLVNYGSSKPFSVGETVIGYFNGLSIINFRVARPDHKFGPFSDPTTTYGINPYFRDETLPQAYSVSSKILNVDTFSLSEEAQGRYSGYLQIGATLVGQTSGAVAYVKDLRLISDNNGDLIGTFFLRDPNTTPPPPVRVSSGNKTYKITSSPTNEVPVAGSTDISFASTNYLSEGTVQLYQDIVRRNTVSANLDTFNTVNTTTITSTTQTAVSQVTLPPEEVNFITNVTNDITNVTNVTNVTEVTNVIQEAARVDPLAQTFIVGANIDAPSKQVFTEDVNGCFLTAVDIYFRTKDPGNSPVTVQIRTVELGTPTLKILGNQKTLRPDQIRTSEDATVPTKFTFDYPIFLPPNNEYAIVILAPESDKYTVWIAEMGEKTINTATLPDAESIRYTTQFAIGSLFKSQNGSIWTSNQYQDLKFKLHKAIFTKSSGTVVFHNPTLDKSNGYVRNLVNNPITTYPRKIKVGITTISDTNLINTLSIGRKVSTNTKSYNYGYIVGTGSSVSSVGITTGGRNYVSDTLVSTYNVIGSGSGLTLNIGANGNGTITSASAVSAGNGYAIGDIVGIVTSTVSSNTGENALITITGNNNFVDTLYLTNVQGDKFNDGTRLVYYNNSGNRVTLASTYISGDSVPVGGIYGGNYFKVDHFDHGMYANNNKLKISNVVSNIPPVSLAAPLNIDDVLINVSVADTSNFSTFEGVPVSSLNPGYIKIDSEIIKYATVGYGSLENITRSQDSTVAIYHPENSLIYKYEVNGVSLRRINTTHDISDTGIDIDSYFVEVNTTTNGTDRSNDGLIDGFGADAPKIAFNTQSSLGGSNVLATENILYTSIVPIYNVITPGALTSVSAQIRTVSGTSVDGNETSFMDQGYENIQLNRENVLSSTRIVASEVNETEYLSNMDLNKSFTTSINLSTKNYNLSPMIFLDTAFTEFVSARLNNPIYDYVTDGRVNSLTNDPHAAIYVSKTINLSQSSNTLKVIIGAYRHSSSDFRVLYSLIRPNSSEIEQSFELFPGYDNLTTDNNLDGYYDIVNYDKNSGLPDLFVPPSLNGEFKEYQYTAPNIGPFIGYKIKIVMSGTDQVHYPRIKDIRTIALV